MFGLPLQPDSSVQPNVSRCQNTLPVPGSIAASKQYFPVTEPPESTPPYAHARIRRYAASVEQTRCWLDSTGQRTSGSPPDSNASASRGGAPKKKRKKKRRKSHPRDRSVSQGHSCMSSLPPRERSGSPLTPIARRLAANDASVTTPCWSTATCFGHHNQAKS